MGPIPEHFNLVLETHKPNTWRRWEIHLYSVESIWQYNSYIHGQGSGWVHETVIRGWSNLYLRFLFFLESFHVGRIGLTLVIFLIAKPRTIPILRKDLPRNKSAQVGESVTMKCLVVLSGTLPDFRWLKWDESITFVSNIRDNFEDGAFQLIDPQYYSTIRQRGESYESELKISNVTEEDFGLYTCYASNHIGAEYNSAFLSRYVRPTRALPSDRGKALKRAMSD